MTAGLSQSAAARLATALKDWDDGRSGMVAAGAVIDAARALLADHERLREMWQAATEQAALAARFHAEEIAGLTFERDRLVAERQDFMERAEHRSSLLDRQGKALVAATEERDRLAGQVQRIRDELDRYDRLDHITYGPQTIDRIRTVLDGGEST